MLGEVGVLIFIYEYVAEEILIMAQKIRIIAQQHIHVVENVVKVHRSGYAAAVGIHLEDIAEHWQFRTTVGGFIIRVAPVHFSRDEGIFGIGDTRGEHIGLVHLFVKSHILHYRFDQGACVGCVVDSESRLEPYKAGMTPQYAQED